MASIRPGPALARRLFSSSATSQPLRRCFSAQSVPTSMSTSEESDTKSTSAPIEERGVRQKKFDLFDLSGKVFVVTGASQGLGLSMAEGLVEAGGTVHCLDIQAEPSDYFKAAKERIDPDLGGGLEYHQVDVSDAESLNAIVGSIADQKQRLDGLVAAAAIQQISPALEYSPDDIRKMMDVNYIGVFLSAQACARQMYKYKIQGSLCLIASMSGLIANRGLFAPVYNSSKAAVIQLARNLAMEWGRKQPDGTGGIRVNSLSPGHILTPMVETNFKKGEADPKEWEDSNMLGRISRPEEFKGAGVFLLSNASSYMTGQNLVVDGGTSAW